MVFFRLYILISTIYDSEDIVQFSYQSDIGKNSPHNDIYNGNLFTKQLLFKEKVVSSRYKFKESSDVLFKYNC